MDEHIGEPALVGRNLYNDFENHCFLNKSQTTLDSQPIDNNHATTKPVDSLSETEGSESHVSLVLIDRDNNFKKNI